MTSNFREDIKFHKQNNGDGRIAKIDPRLQLIILIMCIFTILGILIWLSPRGLALYYESRGKQIIANALSTTERMRFAGIPCANHPLEDENSLTQAYLALENINKALRFYPRSAQAQFLLGRAYCLIGDHTLAVEAYREYIRLQPSNPLGQVELIFAYKRLCETYESTSQGRLSQEDFPLCTDSDSILEIQKIHSVSGVRIDDYITAGIQSIESGDFETAMEFFEVALIIEPSSWKSWINVGTVYEQNSEYSKAIEAYQRAIGVNPGQVDAYYKLADLFLTKIEDFKAALEVYTTAVDIDPVPVNAYIGIGTTQDRLGANIDAMVAYQSAIDLSSQIAFDTKENRRKIIWPRYKLGELYIRLGQLTEARNILQSALDLDRYLEWGDYSHWALGRISMLENLPKQATDNFSEALSISKYPYLRSRILYDLAKAHVSEGELDQGINALRRAKAEDPANQQVYLYLAEILSQMGQYNEAASEYREYLNNWPDDEAVKKLLEEIDQ